MFDKEALASATHDGMWLDAAEIQVAVVATIRRLRLLIVLLSSSSLGRVLILPELVLSRFMSGPWEFCASPSKR